MFVSAFKAGTMLRFFGKVNVDVVYQLTHSKAFYRSGLI